MKCDCDHCINTVISFCWTADAKDRFEKEWDLNPIIGYHRTLKSFVVPSNIAYAAKYFLRMLEEYYPEKLEELNKLLILQ
jgi:hypothetical protein